MCIRELFKEIENPVFWISSLDGLFRVEHGAELLTSCAEVSADDKFCVASSPRSLEVQKEPFGRIAKIKIVVVHGKVLSIISALPRPNVTGSMCRITQR